MKTQKKFILFLLLFLLILPTQLLAESNLANRLKGKILLDVENNGEAWYINPDNLQRYYMGRPADAFGLMRELGTGISESNFKRIDQIKNNLAGKIILRVEDLGQAYYINPDDLGVYFLNRPADAFEIMRELGLGITSQNLSQIHTYQKLFFSTQDIPFQTQAPFSEWAIDMFQDGCEEASTIMTMYWTNYYTDILTKDSMKQKIIDLSNYENNLLNTYRDTSSADLTQIIKNYYNYPNIKNIKNISLKELISQIKKGAIVIAPMNGQILNNPHFTPPGPINHMLVIHGYDEANNQFITNDPGTRHGKDFRYSTDILYKAIRDYPTGYHEENNVVEKNVIVVYR